MTAQARDWAVEQADNSLVVGEHDLGCTIFKPLWRKCTCQREQCVAHFAAALRAAAEEGEKREILDTCQLGYQRGHEAGVREERERVVEILEANKRLEFGEREADNRQRRSSAYAALVLSNVLGEVRHLRERAIGKTS